MKHYTIDTSKTMDLLGRVITLLSLSDITIPSKIAVDILDALYNLASITRRNNYTKKQVQDALIELYKNYSNEETTNFTLALIAYIKDNKIIIVNKD